VAEQSRVRAAVVRRVLSRVAGSQVQDTQRERIGIRGEEHDRFDVGRRLSGRASMGSCQLRMRDWRTLARVTSV